MEMNNCLKSDIIFESFGKGQDIITQYCRTCMQQCNHSSQIFYLFKDKKIMDIFSVCTNLELYEADGLPEYICMKCYNQLHSYHSFRIQCATSDLFFRQNLLQDSIFNDDNYNLDNFVEDDQDQDAEINEEKENNITSITNTTMVSPEISVKDENLHFIEAAIKDVEDIEVDLFVKDQFLCDICNARICDKKLLRKHFKTVHRPMHHCTYDNCDKSFGFQHNLKRHIDETHLNIRSRSSSKFIPKSCEICGKKFLKPQHYDGHIRQHNGLDPFECKPCNRTFIKWVTLKNHNAIHHNSILLPKHSCLLDNCSKMYKTVDSLRAHQKLIHKNNLSAKTLTNYICELCGKSFLKRFALKSHMYRHTGEPWSCNLCSKKFFSKYSLKMHLRRHDGVKSYSCPLCGIQKTTGSELKAHINQHTQEKKYPCKECSAVFDAYANLYSHIRSVHRMLKPYKCTYCDRSFSKTDALKHHIMIHTNEKPHECLICNHRFIQKSALKKHIRTHTKVKI